MGRAAGRAFSTRMTPRVQFKTPVGVKGKNMQDWWCACGLSRDATFCDGNHNKTDIIPMEITDKLDPEETYWICRCKHTGTPPFCDGSHRKLAVSGLLPSMR